MSKHGSGAAGVIKSLGLVFGDIGTSPIYTITVIFIFLQPTPENIIGVLSLIVWTLLVLITLKYTWLAMSLGKKGEGGTIVLREILLPHLRSARQTAFVTLLSFIGISLLFGDGVITPAISILSAVEGLRLVPGFDGISQGMIILMSMVIAITLFAFQRKGTNKVAFAFGPIMVVWFVALSAGGIASILESPVVLTALNPLNAIAFMTHNGLAGFVVLSEVILCATGGEAMYADMGHLGREPIIRAWYFAFVALLLSYLGQGAYLMTHPEAENILFEMTRHHSPMLYVPFLFLTVAATIIASQAMISGIFSIIYQGINTHIMPIFKVDYTSEEMHSTIYIGVANWMLLTAVLAVMWHFGESSKLAAAYGFAATGTMSVTGILMTWIFTRRGQGAKAMLAACITLVDFTFLAANFTKLPHGGFWSIVIASLPFTVIMLFTRGQRHMYKNMRPMDSEEFLHIFKYKHEHDSRLKGTALYFTRYAGTIPPFVYNTMFMNGIIYEDNIIVALGRRDDPFGVTGFFHPDIAPGLRHFEVQYGYMEVFDMEDVLREAGIREKVIFYGIEDVRTSNIAWKLFSLLKRISPTFVQFLKLPSFKLHGVVTRVEM